MIWSQTSRPVFRCISIGDHHGVAEVVACTYPAQFECLNKKEEIEPDEYSKRFGLRQSPELAIERAKDFMEWTPKGVSEKEKMDPKEYVLVEVELTPIGYLQKCESGVLLKYKTNEYRWHGGMKAMGFDANGNLLCKFSNEAHTVM